MFHVSLEDAQKTSSPQRTPTKQNSHSIQGQLLLGWVKKQGVNQAVNHGEVHPLWVMTHAGCITGGHNATCNSPLKNRPRLSKYLLSLLNFHDPWWLTFLGVLWASPNPPLGNVSIGNCCGSLGFWVFPSPYQGTEGSECTATKKRNLAV